MSRSTADKLDAWRDAPESVAEYDLIPPTPLAIGRARREEAAKPGWDRVVPDGDGGIVMERWSGVESLALEISADGTAEEVLTRCGSVMTRRPLP